MPFKSSRRVRALFAGGATSLAFAAFGSVVHAAPVLEPSACLALKGAPVPGGRIEAARWLAEGEAKPPAFGPAAGAALPAHCLLEGVTGAHQDRAGRTLGVRFELRAPAAWNGRLLFQGGGGLDGIVTPAFGAVSAGPPALARGFAVISMDGGHQGQDASFASNQQARLDFAYAAIGKATAAAKTLVAALYATNAQRTYFVGCSNGGREAMMAVQRYPLEFDGVVAGAPGFNLSHAALGEAWATQQWARIAPKDAQGLPRLGAALTDADLKLVSGAVEAECDGLDGLVDGIINNRAACRFRPDRLGCRGQTRANCLSAPKLAALKAVMDGARDHRGDRLYAGFPYDTGLSDPDWRRWMLGVDGGAPALNVVLGGDSLARYFMTPQQPNRDPYTLDVTTARQAVAQTGAINDATGALLTSFTERGGRLLIYQGVSDPVFSAEDIADWYQRLGRDSPESAEGVRLFMVPGMTHCFGGRATDRFDPLAAIQAWVEQGQAPARLLAESGGPAPVRRPLCPYPTYARYVSGDPRRAESFACAAPPPSKPGA